MKTLLFTLLLAFFTSENATQTVYVCTGPTAYAYHKTPKCKGLKRCSGEIIQISVEKAKADKRKACKICFGKRQTI